MWIDQDIVDKERNTPVASCEGPWLPTVEKLLSGTEYRLHLLNPDLFWIGHPRRLEAAREAYQVSLSKIQWAELKPASALMDDTRMEFIETPLGQVLEFLRDQHDTNFTLLGGKDTPVTFNVKGLPLHLALTILTQRLQYDWCADREIIFVGPRDQLERIRQRALSRLQRWARLGLADNAVKRALRSDTRLEFIQTPLYQVADFLSAQHNVPIRVAEANRQVRVTLNLKGVSLEQALDAMCLQLDLPWNTDGKSIVIGADKL